MNWAALLFAIAYLALKLTRLLFIGRSPAYQAEPVNWNQRLRASEPWLLIITALVTVPPTLAATCYHQHVFAADLDRSLDCYRLIVAYRDAPDIMHSNGEHAVYLASEKYGSTASVSAYQLGWTRAALKRRIDQLVSEKTSANRALQASRIVEVQRCLHPPIPSRNE